VLYPWGVKEESKDYLSLFLSLEKGNPGVHALFTLSILIANKKKQVVASKSINFCFV